MARPTREHWFRMYDRVVHDAKIQALRAATCKGWLNCMCLASDNEGVLPPLGKVAFALHMSEQAAERLVETLIQAHLFDRRPDGAVVPHDWGEWQYVEPETYDPTAAERARRYRDRKRDASRDSVRDASRDASRVVTGEGGKGGEYSESVSASVSASENTTEKPLKPEDSLGVGRLQRGLINAEFLEPGDPQVVASNGDLWPEYIGVILAGGRKLNDADLEAGLRIWLCLNELDRANALADMRSIAHNRAPQYIPFPRKHLGDRQFDRRGPERSLPPARETESRAERGQRLAADEFLHAKTRGGQ